MFWDIAFFRSQARPFRSDPLLQEVPQVPHQEVLEEEPIGGERRCPTCRSHSPGTDCVYSCFQNFLRVVATTKDTYSLKYFKVDQDEEADEE